MKARDLEAVLRAAWIATEPTGLSTGYDEQNVGLLRRALTDADPHGVYRPQAPQAPGIDLDETQDIPLRDCPRLRPLPAESGDAT